MFKLLKAQLSANDIDQPELCRLLGGKSPGYVTARTRGRRPWNQDEMYILMNRLSIPYAQWNAYFPPGGKDLPGVNLDLHVDDGARSVRLVKRSRVV